MLSLKAIIQYQRPYFDVLVKDPAVFTTLEGQTPKDAAKWIVENGIEILNVAGNSERTAKGIEKFVERYLLAMLKTLE